MLPTCECCHSLSLVATQLPFVQFYYNTTEDNHVAYM